MLVDKILQNKQGIMLYGMTPPRDNVELSEKERLGTLHRERVQSIGCDGVVLYDIQDESDRNESDRVFGLIEPIVPEIYYRDWMRTSVPAVIYKVVGKYDRAEFEKFINELSPNSICVFVGASSSSKQVKIHLNEAYEIAKSRTDIVYGGICIPERHITKGDEHLRVAQKIQQGCKFFITQAVYDDKNAKKFLDYYAKLDAPKVPIIFTFTPCGSARSLEFMKWLGIEISPKTEQELLGAQDMLAHSMKHSAKLFGELYEYGKRLGISIGANVESVAKNKTDIAAAVTLFSSLKTMI
ncbi:methylenetetrahydrofolate reductase [Campylobacter sp. RM12920]|uniref:Methylenetetrahydrofolate reductase n=3 Tax=Campylobacter californiensis TaxID=1032243 RepID=A0ABD4JJ73_9BACT|nr:methylenetetrahydrofolate reductase [Campylobacter sp. RM6914]MBE2986664.1 methylenetetrahydrofolate reductase [Campylobacter sp. RM12919]MBE2988832.1 methylenetetrahydrofolate reductase [Campylobacter sp. RM12920]MBE2995431.1 methylenetetrahydrofolate reductase [Campylobacter sp. RM6913]QCD49989.1 methylenetetrahydrofolate reductase family protein [Campylobacter sp. RM6914]